MESQIPNEETSGGSTVVDSQIPDEQKSNVSTEVETQNHGGEKTDISTEVEQTSGPKEAAKSTEVDTQARGDGKIDVTTDVETELSTEHSTEGVTESSASQELPEMIEDKDTGAKSEIETKEPVPEVDLPEGSMVDDNEKCSTIINDKTEDVTESNISQKPSTMAEGGQSDEKLDEKEMQVSGTDEDIQKVSTNEINEKCPTHVKDTTADVLDFSQESPEASEINGSEGASDQKGMQATVAEEDTPKDTSNKETENGTTEVNDTNEDVVGSDVSKGSPEVSEGKDSEEEMQVSMPDGDLQRDTVNEIDENSGDYKSTECQLTTNEERKENTTTAAVKCQITVTSENNTKDEVKTEGSSAVRETTEVSPLENE